jgi:putative flippase GtrA
MAKEFWRLVRFGLTGIVATLTYGGVSYALVESSVSGPIAAAVFGYLASATVSYFGHIHFSFRVEPDHRKFIWRFVTTSIVTFPMAVVITYIITTGLGRSNQIAVVAVMVLIPLMNYFCNRFWVFGPSLAANPDNTKANSVVVERRIDQA